MAQPDLPGDLLLDIGFNVWSAQNDSLSGWGSKSLGVYYNRRFKISNSLSFYPAVGLTFEKFDFKDNANYFRQADGSIAVDTLRSSFDIRKNKVAATYLEIPLELRFHPKGTIEGEGFFVGVGVIGGIKMGSHTKIKYREGDNRRKEKLRGNFGLSDFRYGLQARIGWKNIHVFFKKYFSEVYRNKQTVLNNDLQPTDKEFNPTLTTIGINFSGF